MFAPRASQQRAQLKEAEVCHALKASNKITALVPLTLSFPIFLDKGSNIYNAAYAKD